MVLLHGAAAARSPSSPASTSTPVDVRRRSANFDLTSSSRTRTAGLAGSVEYSTDLFDADTVARHGRST